MKSPFAPSGGPAPHSQAVYPGSFDPITYGHIAMVRRFRLLFKSLTLLVASSIHKQYWFSLEEREDMARHALKSFPEVRVESHRGLTVDWLKRHKTVVVLRGLRSALDFSYERDMALNNKKIFPQMETLFLFSDPETETGSAKWIKEIAFHKGDLSGLVPPFAQKRIREKVLLEGEARS